MLVLLTGYRELKSLPQDVHWLCNAYEAAQEAPRVKSEYSIGENVDLRQEQVCDCLRLFAFDGEDVSQFQEELAVGIDTQLSRCDLCVVGYYKSRQKLIEQLRK